MGVDDVDRKAAQVRAHFRRDRGAHDDQSRLDADDPEPVKVLLRREGWVVARCDDRHLMATGREFPRHRAHVALDAAEVREEPR